MTPLASPWPDISRFAAGNTGIDYVWSFDAGPPGPHVMVNALTHGNEPCGAVAIAALLDDGIRPARGRLTLSFANIAAYRAFRDEGDVTARFLDRDLNRLWRDDWIAADKDSREAARAREMAPLLGTVDMLLDLHSTASVATPFFVIAELEKTRRLADAMAWPPLQQLMPGGCQDGRHMVDYGRFSDPDCGATAVTVDCGRHLDPAAGDIAIRAARRFLAICEIGTGAADETDTDPIRRYRTGEPYIVQFDAFRLAIPEDGFVPVAKGGLVAMDGELEVRAPHDTTIIAPRPTPEKGSTAFIWTTEVDEG